MNSSPTTVLRNVLTASQRLDYKGYNKHDGLLSPFLYNRMIHTKILRLIAIQFVMRFPINIRPLLFVPPTRNPKGIGLFTHAYLTMYETTKKKEYLYEAELLLDWLEKNISPHPDGFAWGYQYPWQDVGFFAPANFPNRVVTCWIGYSYVKAWHITRKKKYRTICQRICSFLHNAPHRIEDTDNELCYSYVPVEGITWAVMDVSALVAKMFALTGKLCNDSSLLHDAKRCMHYVINRQTSYGAWYYTHPSKDSPIQHDNYHTGIILDCLYDYMKAINSKEHMNAYTKGLEYYTSHLFLDNGAPKWMNNKTYPFDIHGAAQGIISFTKASESFPEYVTMAERVLQWTMNHLYNSKTHSFYYQKGVLYTKKFTLMRWCNAWMSYALSEFETLHRKQRKSEKRYSLYGR